MHGRGLVLLGGHFEIYEEVCVCSQAVLVYYVNNHSHIINVRVVKINGGSMHGNNSVYICSHE